MLATILNHQECVRVLLDHNALVNVTDHTGFNGLIRIFLNNGFIDL